MTSFLIKDFYMLYICTKIKFIYQKSKHTEKRCVIILASFVGTEVNCNQKFGIFLLRAQEIQNSYIIK